MKKIPLGNSGKFTIVDDIDFVVQKLFKWYPHGKYAARRSGNKTIYLHRVIACTPVGKDTDHINGDKLDNRRANLRVASRSQNNMNRQKKKESTSIFKGVCFDSARKKWMAQIQIQQDGKRRMKGLGRFDSEKEAAIAYNCAALYYHRGFAVLNDV